MKGVLRHLSSFTAPFLLCLVVPYLIAWQEQGSRVPAFASSRVQALIGLLITLAAFVLLVANIRMFILIGNGTIMPWDPTRKLITGSLYAYVRNPMIMSVILVQVGEAVLFASRGIALLAGLNFLINTVYFILLEEPGLEKRFGAKYLEYKKNVPRWLPRLKPWRPG
ncbi:MAG TPA: isoprenylcysteine carboxylmethyltransferase family protein [Anaerolineales bacterium]|jgi:protein-S-isoprenylcysteine O-methyltransferase Ste14